MSKYDDPIEAVYRDTINQTLQAAIKACEGERLEDNTGDATDESYNQAIQDCIKAIKKLLLPCDLKPLK